MQTIDQKKEEFQRYLEKSGILDSITRMLATLNDMPEKPEDARDFVREYLAGVGPTETDILKSEIEKLTRQLKDKEDAIDELKSQVKELKEKYEKTDKTDKV